MKLKTTAIGLALLGILSFVSPYSAMAEESQVMPTSVAAIKALADDQLRNGELSAAIGNYKKALVSDPSLKAVYFNLAIAYYTDRQIEQAAKSLEKLIQISPSDTEAIYNLACLKMYLGDIGGAEKCFRDAASSCGQESRFKSLIEDGFYFLGQIKQLDPERQMLLFSLFRQGAIPALAS